MFKLESYITPVILSYVEKYVKNFKPEQSQVSLWGGDASFQNLDLRLEVLEEQLNLPFDFVSGHIHELLIHVPWVKITSEPIVITINTIECILKLKDESKRGIPVPQPQRERDVLQEDTPPGYIKSIVTKVVNNITINCNNLILKYVEEDIVLSINVRFLSMQTVDDKWEPAFTDVNTYGIMLRKIINIQDLTLCLDKMDASGKIEIYQDPVLYRCSMTIRLIINYLSNTAKRASITRLDLHCQKMEFSMTEQQIPMLLRLIALLSVLQTRQFPSSKEKSIISTEDREDSAADETSQIPGTTTDTVGWGGWAWNMVSSFLPVEWDNDWSTEQHMAYAGHTIHLGLYVDDATITFKTIESVKEQVFYKSRKLRYKSFLSLRLNAVVVDILLQGIAMSNFQVGCGSVRLYPRGTCSCGHYEVADGTQPPLYLVAGKTNTDYLKDSLFDEDAIENQGRKRDYKQGVDHHLTTVPVKKLLERCPAFIMDYVHCVQIPEDVTPERLAELGSNLEYSNFHERRLVRYVLGDLTIRLCSGVFHRFETIKQAAANYDYNPYISPKPDPSVSDLPPVTLEEYEALRENISMMETEVVLIKSCLQIQLADHRITGLPRQRKLTESRIAPLTPALTDDPFLSIECDELTLTMVEPLYSFRLAACAARQIDLSPDMFDKCHQNIHVQFTGAKSQLYLLKNNHTSMVMPFSGECVIRKLLYPQYWSNPDMTRESYSFHLDAVTITGTKAKMMVATSIITSLLKPTDTTNPLICSSLYADASQESSPTYLELALESVRCTSLSSFVMNSNQVKINSVKVFALNDTQQAFILSGPEASIASGEERNEALLTAVIQYPLDAGKRNHPPLVFFRVAEIRGSLDPLFLRWLEYRVTYYKLGTPYTARAENQQLLEAASSDTGTRKKTFPSLNESVHSASDKEKRKSSNNPTTTEQQFKSEEIPQGSQSKTDSEHENSQKSGILVRLAELYPWWSGLVLSGSIGHIVIYIPSTTMSGIDADGIEHARTKALRENKDLQILIIRLPIFRVNSSNITSELLSPYLQTLPVNLPKTMWMQQSQCFPWTVSFFDFHCYTTDRDAVKNFINKVSLNATIALTTKTSPSSVAGNLLSALGLCVHIDNSPIVISISEEQVVFMSKIICNVSSALNDSSDEYEGNATLSQSLQQTQILAPPAIPQTPSSPTQALYTENATTTSTVSTSKEESPQEKDGTIVTAWIQWTITKIALKLYAMGKEEEPSYKLAIELEDIITSLDLQPVYLKLKNKITTATVFHYTRAPHSGHSWEFGEYVGLILCGREDGLQKGEDLGFLNVTLTRAKAGNVHTRWGAHKRQKAPKKESATNPMMTQNGYITEVVVKMQMVDTILPLSVFSEYTKIVKPLLQACQIEEAAKEPKELKEAKEAANDCPSLSIFTNLNNETLPLIYLEFKGLRVMVPGTTADSYELQDDLLMLQLDGISITPHAENPICRTPLRLDIYQLAAQANILNVPGSAVEDRQYQINVKNVCAYTTTWKNYQISVNKRLSQSYLYTMNENPALEWNKLGNRGSFEPRFSTFPIFTKFDVCLVVAPTIIFKPDTVVCGSAVEVNCLTDLELTMNLDQIKLLSVLGKETTDVLTRYLEFERPREKKISIEKTSPSVPEKLTKGNHRSKTRPNHERETDVTRDSGVELDMSSVNSTIVAKLPLEEIPRLPPFEFLVNCGKITLTLYESQRSVTNALCRNDALEAEEDDADNPKRALFFAMMDQPNLYISQQRFTRKMRISCFDVTIALGNGVRRDPISVPTASDFQTYILETRNGPTHPDTGIPPSFLTVKCEKTPGKNTQFFIDIGRPTKIHFSLGRLREIDDIRQKITSSLSVGEDTTPSHHSETNAEGRIYVPDLNLCTNQIVFSFVTDDDNDSDDDNHASEIVSSLSSLRGSITTLARPDRIYSNTTVDSLIVSSVLVADGTTKVLLNPWCCNVTVYLLWESWQETKESTPQIQVQADSESIYLDFGPRQMKIINTVIRDCRILSERFFPASRKDERAAESRLASCSEQHYKDDLKAGAFQFIDGNADELPFSYQVIFFGYPRQAMAWRYPQPRTLTKIHVSPVPFETLDGQETYTDKVPCTLEYWSDSHGGYRRYVDFYLSETESYRLDLPESAPARAVACVWRVLIHPFPSLLANPSKRSGRRAVVSARVLAACLRIDSYFNSSIIPNVQAALNIGTINLSFHNHVDLAAYASSQPVPQKKYVLEGRLPEDQCFMTLRQERACFVLNGWTDGSTLLDITCRVTVQILDYGHLVMQEVTEPLDGKFQLSFSDRYDGSLTCSPFSIKISPAVVHTLAVSSQLWAASLEDVVRSSDLRGDRRPIILTRYVVANDSNVPIRFGQSGTDDSILLGSRRCCFYTWRKVGNQTIRVSIEENAWSWSKSFPVNEDGLRVVEFTNGLIDTAIFVAVKSLSATQKLVEFSGQLIVANRLSDAFEMKLIRYEAGSESKVTVLREAHVLSGNDRPPSILIENDKKLAMRLRFTSIANSSWTGDIPLRANSRWAQPWLVKVPLEERGRFLSIWVRIVAQTIQGRIKLLAVLSPLYAVRSHLPVPVRVRVETPSLKSSLSATINGRGEVQQLYCPGTFEHFHQLTFQLEASVSGSDPYVPLSYGSVDQRKFFVRPDVEDIEGILRELESDETSSEARWPFQADDEPAESWIPAEQPQTHVQVKYRDAGFASSTLLLELQPWCFVLNTLGCRIALVSSDVELCQVPHYGIVTPPRLEDTFHVAVGAGDGFYTSQPLQLTRTDWSQSFYVPRVAGLIPVEGVVKTLVDCGASVVTVTIGSSMREDMRLLRVTASHAISNLTSLDIRVAPVVVPETASELRFPEEAVEFEAYCLDVPATSDGKRAVPIVHWYYLRRGEDETFVPYLVLALGQHPWSCPIPVDRGTSRRCVAVPNSANTTVPLVVTTQEDRGTIYVSVQLDDHPQLFLENSTSLRIVLGEANETADGIVPDATHFSWTCEIESGASTYYSLPSIAGRLPDSSFPGSANVLLLSAIESGKRRERLRWSRGVGLAVQTAAPTDQFVRLPAFGDVKLLMQSRCYTVYISIVPISQVEISARDIRYRLSRRDSNLQTTRPLEQTDETVPLLAGLGLSPRSTSPLSAREAEKLAPDIGDTGRSMSITSFLTAQEDVATFTDSLASSPDRETPRTSVTGIGSCDHHLTTVEEIPPRRGSVVAHMQGVTIVITKDTNENGQRAEVASLSMSDVVLVADAEPNARNLCLCIGDMQLDNQMFDQGGFDFPVVLISQKLRRAEKKTIYADNRCLIDDINRIKKESLLVFDYVCEINGEITAGKELRLKIAPVSAYIEDTYITQLLEYATSLVPPCHARQTEESRRTPITDAILVPDCVIVDARILAAPLRLQSFTIEPLSVLLSVHTSVRLYVALDHSPLHFGIFERRNLLTTPYRLGNALTMHYLSGAIFGAGWVVGSLEILGSPGGLAQALGSGLRDFVSLPFQGLLHGPWGFIVGITHGSASLMKHVTAGTVNSVTKLASSVARNLDRLTLDEEHLHRQEESRRTRPQGMAQGLYQGLTGFGMSLLAAVAGLAHHPLQQVWSGEATTKGLVTGVGLGLVGVVTKPLSGAAELVALTGQGLLQGAGWNSLPSPRQRPVMEYNSRNDNASVRYAWRLLPLLENSQDSILHVTSADYVVQQGSNRAVTLVLTRQALLLVNTAEDTVERVFSLKDLTSIDHPAESTTLCLYCPPEVTVQTNRPQSPIEHEMNEEMRARVAEYVRTSSAGLASMSTNSDGQSDTFETVTPHPEHTVTFYVTSDSRNYLLTLFNIAKRQNQAIGFKVL